MTFHSNIDLVCNIKSHTILYGFFCLFMVFN
uniref:Uncharacterized protein n=1 Tax=Myoviridae sp. ctNQV2 TaxID=2827683 RepID=A0A8S5RYK9_9CAUD|nr:MAG TPA: hypothetical protein [Myoviridae sp. ctNQV2]